MDLDGIDGNDTYVEFDQAAMIDTDSSRIVTSTGTIIVDDSTQFLVKNAGNTYTAYTLSTIPSFADSAVIYYTVGSDNIADRVYVKSGVEKAELGNYLYVTTDNYHQIAGTNDYYMNVVIDGVERTIATTKTIVEYLAANEGKVFEVSWELNPYVGTYGFVDDARLVNEAVDSSWSGDINYLTGDVTFANGVIVNDGESYRINSDTVFVGGNAVTSAVYANNGIWVNYSDNGQQLVVDVIYIGAKLDESVALTVDAKDGTVTYDADTKTFTVNSVKDATSDVLTYTANDANSVVVAPAETALYTVTETVYDNNPSRSVTVYNEAGTDSETYTVNLKWNVKSSNAQLASVKVDGTDVTIPSGGNDTVSAAEKSAVQLGAQNKFTMTVQAKNPLATVEIGSGDTIENAEKNLAERDSVTVTDTTQLNGGYVLIKVTAEDNTVRYYAYNTAS